MVLKLVIYAILENIDFGCKGIKKLKQVKLSVQIAIEF